MKDNKKIIITIAVALLVIIVFSALSNKVTSKKETSIEGSNEEVREESTIISMLDVLNQYVQANNMFVKGENVKSLINLVDNRYSKEYGPDITQHIKENISLINDYSLKGVYIEYTMPDCIIYRVDFNNNGKTDTIRTLVHKKQEFSIFPKDISLDKIVKYVNESNEELQNSYTYSVNNEIKIRAYYSYYLNLYNADKENSIKLIDEEYFSSKFEGIDDYTNYVDEYFSVPRAVKILDEYKKNGVNYYVFSYGGEKRIQIVESGTLRYKIKFDEYTTLPEKYDTLSNKEKAEYVKDLFCDMVKNKDYEKIYEHLDETFKNNNYSNYEDLVNVFEQLDIDNKRIESQKVTNRVSQIYTYNLAVFGNDIENEGAYLVDLIIKIENSDYTWSFSIVKVDNIE